MHYRKSRHSYVHRYLNISIQQAFSQYIFNYSISASLRISKLSIWNKLSTTAILNSSSEEDLSDFCRSTTLFNFKSFSIALVISASYMRSVSLSIISRPWDTWRHNYLLRLQRWLQGLLLHVAIIRFPLIIYCINWWLRLGYVPEHGKFYGFLFR